MVQDLKRRPRIVNIEVKIFKNKYTLPSILFLLINYLLKKGEKKKVKYQNYHTPWKVPNHANQMVSQKLKRIMIPSRN